MTNTVFVVNPASGNGADGKAWPKTRELAASRGLQGESVLTEAPGHATELARRAAEDGASLALVLLALIAPVLIVLAFAAMIVCFVLILRTIRRRRQRAATPAPGIPAA